MTTKTKRAPRDPSLFHNPEAARRAHLVCKIANILDWPAVADAVGRGGEDATLPIGDETTAEFRTTEQSIDFIVRFHRGTLSVRIAPIWGPPEARINFSNPGMMRPEQAAEFARNVTLWSTLLSRIAATLGGSECFLEHSVAAAAGVWREMAPTVRAER